MPEPQKAVVVGAKHATLGVGDYVTFRNLSRSGKVTEQCNSSGEAIVKNVPSGWTNKDVISATVQGKYTKGVQGIITKGGLKLNFGTLTAYTATVAVDL